MRRIFAVFAAAIMLSATACSNKKDKEKGDSGNTPVVTDISGNGIEVIATNAEESTETGVSTAVEESTETVTTAVSSEDFTFPEDDPEFEEKLDDEVIAAAQLLFEKACETEWNFTEGETADAVRRDIARLKKRM